MLLLSWLPGFREAKTIALHAQTLLDRCTHRIDAAMIARSAELPRAEALGYLRAKAMHRLVAAISTSGDAAVAAIPSRLHAAVLATAVDRLTAALWRHREQRQAVAAPRRRVA